MNSSKNQANHKITYFFKSEGRKHKHLLYEYTVCLQVLNDMVEREAAFTEL